jgi:hypothetical protein
MLCSLSVHAVATERPIGANCELTSPPNSAGEEMNHGMVLRIFPRAKDIHSSYNGCQALLAPDAGKWVTVSLTEIVNGDPIRVWSAFEKDLNVLACRFKEGKVIRGNPATCPASEFLLIKSVAPGCVRIIQGNIAKHGLGTPWPQECRYD